MHFRPSSKVGYLSFKVKPKPRELRNESREVLLREDGFQAAPLTMILSVTRCFVYQNI